VGNSREDIQRVFRTWLDLSSVQELLWLLELVEEALRCRGYPVQREEPRPGRPKA